MPSSPRAQRVLARSNVRRQHFDSDNTIQPRISRLVHLAHAAGADWREGFIGPETSPWLERHGGRSILYASRARLQWAGNPTNNIMPWFRLFDRTVRGVGVLSPLFPHHFSPLVLFNVPVNSDSLISRMVLRIGVALAALVSLNAAEQPSTIKRAIADPFDNVCIPQLASGGGWKTTITIVNMDTRASSFSLLFADSAGRDVSLQLNTPSGSVNASQVSGTLPVNGSVTYETAGGAGLVQAWGLLVHNGLGGRSGIVAGQAVFQQQVAGRPAFEAAAPISALSERRVRLPFDNTNGFQTGVAVTNFDTINATITGTAYDDKGESLGSGSFALDVAGQRAFVLSEAFPFTARQRGVIELSSSGRSMCSMGLRFHPGGAFTSTPPLSLPSW